ncbi:isoleucyl-tRNA synthetase, putative [Ichthyophthirius multifiliis]|uniref:Isoleucyl-tRNA synthetase, putative n=1 Tax=Ichthyophthirius multifiliis TaxID=5932 RepID=G0QVT2_ICHMU|nr:isoleucyl-tRNA synthetase, putative [Ichthyophthirius multifiliis]EGR30670.1 isoleucyl-tRNA synthetase, putative [Ichthyophthirius multifiliis]|eukprot:XP_004032257.1 isoleucyl-tRNA synthetase, putative [Ichthyophthirius multifiliis]
MINYLFQKKNISKVPFCTINKYQLLEIQEKEIKIIQQKLQLKKDNLYLHIPKTKFNPRFHPLQNEQKYNAQISQNLYQWQQTAFKNSKKQLLMHDLPFQTYGEPHFGHFYNRIQQDIATRFAVLQGIKVTQQIGFNLHGQTIQNQALFEDLEEKKELIKYSDDQIREIAQKYAHKSLDKIINQYKKWGLMYDFYQAYLTSHNSYQKGVLEAFNQLVEEKRIFVDQQICLWSIKYRRSLDDDESEMQLRQKPTNFVCLEIINYKESEYLKDLIRQNKIKKLFVIITINELYQLNSLRAVEINENVEYGIYQMNNGIIFILSRKRFKQHRLYFKEKGAKLIGIQTGRQISQLQLFEEVFQRKINFLNTDQFAINEKFGSGIRSVIPGNNIDDFTLGQKLGIIQKACIDEQGRFTYEKEVPEGLKGLQINNGEANRYIQDLLISKNLLLEGIHELVEINEYIDKKSKEKLILRTQPTVFCMLPNFEKEDFIEKINIVPQNTIEETYSHIKNMLKQKTNKWAISSKAQWGIPIPIFIYKHNTTKYLIDKSIIQHNIQIFQNEGCLSFFNKSIIDLLPQKYKNQSHLLEKANFVFDIWFESGCSWYTQLKSQENEEQNTPTLKQADLSILGTDQCDSWLLSSSLLCIGLREEPFISDESVLATCQVLQYLPQLQVLFLGLDSITLKAETLNQCFQAVSKSAKISNISLSIIHNKIQDSGIEQLAEGISSFQNKNLRKLNLILISNEITSVGAQKLAQAVQKIQSLNTLQVSLYANKLGAEGAQQISEIMLPQLQNFHLDLYFNNITDIGARSLSNKLINMQNLTELKLNLDFNYILNEGGQYIGESLKKLTSLKALNLGVATKNFGTSGFEHIANGISNLVNLEELRLACGVNKLGPFGINYLKIAFSRLDKLKKLDLDYYENSLGDPNGKKVNELLDALGNLEELNLNFAFNNLLDYGTIQILKGIQRLKKLKKLKLDFGSNEIDDDSVESILKEVDIISKQVDQFQFEFLNTAITKEVSEKIRQRYQDINNIKVSVNSNVSKEYLENKKNKKEQKQQKQQQQ